MSGILSFLSELGLGDLEKENIYEEKENTIKSRAGARNMVPKLEEKDIIYSRVFECPVCGLRFSSMVMKTGKTKLCGTDLDLRPKFEGIDSGKYDVLLCDHCGNAMLSKFFGPISPKQAKMIQEKITRNLKNNVYTDDTYSYEQAIERYKIALACALVRITSNSEKAYICMKMGWIYRGQREYLEEQRTLLPKQREELLAKEKEYLKTAAEGFMLARAKENFPICGMDTATYDYLIAALAYLTEQYDIAGRLVGDLVVKKGVNSRIKDKARDLKDLILKRNEKA